MLISTCVFLPPKTPALYAKKAATTTIKNITSTATTPTLLPPPPPSLSAITGSSLHGNQTSGAQKSIGLALVLSEMCIKRIVCRRGNTRTGDTEKGLASPARESNFRKVKGGSKPEQSDWGAVRLTSSASVGLPAYDFSLRRWPLRPGQLLLAVQLCGTV